MIYIVIPAYNEEKNIEQLIMDAHTHLNNMPHTILVVNDGSKDRTPDVIRSLVGKLPVRLINQPVNMGVGKAFFAGFAIAADELKDDEIVITIEADATNDPFLIQEMVSKLNEGYDVVCASRHIKGGGYYNFPSYRLLLSRGVNFIMRAVFPIKDTYDYSIFFRAYRVSILKKAFKVYGNSLITKRGFASNAEVLIKLRRLGMRCSEVPLKYKYDLKKSESGMKIFNTIKEYLGLCCENIFG